MLRYMLWVSRLKNGTSRQQKSIGNSRQLLYLKIIFSLNLNTYKWKYWIIYQGIIVQIFPNVSSY